MIRIRAFRAIDDIKTCKKFIKGHDKVLKSIGVEKVSSSNTTWYKDPNVIVVIAESISGHKVYGGGRIHIAGGRYPLPISEALADMDPKIHNVINKYSKKGAAEYCGLWNSYEVSGMGIGSIFLARAGIATACIVGKSSINLTTLFALNASYIMRIAKNTGFEVEHSLGDNGTFNYPKEEFKAYVNILKNIHTLEKANPIDKAYITDLIKKPVQVKIENWRNHLLQIEYDLLIPNLSKTKKNKRIAKKKQLYRLP